MRFRTATKEYRGDSAVGLVLALRRDPAAVTAKRRPSHAFLGAWISAFDGREEAAPRGPDAETRALELLYLCHEYELGVFARSDEEGRSA